ncbi:hypothetical protein B0H19DRAFT_1160922 [Mycena capillaripes]|nr:hypothetical protein B0H19DRAFT_1160922 [Mycena capillaripes]
MVVRDILQLDHAPKEIPDICEKCAHRGSVYFCRTCFWPEYLCHVCMRDAHLRQPLHRIEVGPASGFEVTADMSTDLYRRCFKGMHPARSRRTHPARTWGGGLVRQSHQRERVHDHRC